MESPYDPGLGPDRMDWTTGMSQPLFGTERLDYLNYAAETYDFQDPTENPYGDNDETVDDCDIVLYIGHGNSDVFTFTSPLSPQTFPYYAGQKSWGNHSQEWMCLLSCDVLDFTNSSGMDVAQRWLPNFDGVHFVLGFATEAYAETGFPLTFAQDMANTSSPMSIYGAWFAAASARGTGAAAVLAPIGPKGVLDLTDHWWGVGTVGPAIRASQIQGWLYIVQSHS